MVESAGKPATSSTQPFGGGDIPGALRKTLSDHWKWFLAEGIILVILGIAAVAAPLVAGVATTLFVGWLFLFAGVAGLVATFSARTAPGFWWSELSSFVVLIAGLVLLWNPLHGLITLTYVLIAYFIVDGILTIILALEHRKDLSDRWQWLVVNGVIDLILAGIVISGLPGAFAWALGLLVGIDLVFGGSSLIAMAMAARKTESVRLAA
ncbi:MAG: HdeD family acid-resistance protein [Methylocella sp.]